MSGYRARKPALLEEEALGLKRGREELKHERGVKPLPVSSTRDGRPNREHLRQSKPSFCIRRRTARGTSSRAGHRKVDETRTGVRLGTFALSDVTGDVRATRTCAFGLGDQAELNDRYH